MPATATDSAASATPVPAAVLGRSCPTCGRALPIDPALAGARAARWICESCQRPLTGVLAMHQAPSLGGRVRFAPMHFDTTASEAIPGSLRQLVAELLIRRRRRQEIHDRRRNPRVPCDLDAVVLGLDELWLPCREPIHAVVIDLAAHGLGMMTATCVHDERLAIQIACPAGPVQLLGRRAWTNMVGDTFQNTGVEFIARLGKTALKAVES